VIHVFWHLPLFFTGDIPPADVVYILAASVVFAWLVIGSGGSVLLAMIMHASSNAVSGEYISPMFTGGDGDLLGWIRALIWCVFAVTVVIAAPRTFRSRPMRKQPA
jgi:membrane protease YdiL (CAAX protease family)